MPIWAAGLAAFFITSLLIQDIASVFQWLPLALIIIAVVKVMNSIGKDEAEPEEKTGVVFDNGRKFLPGGMSTLKAGKEILCEWRGKEIVFYEDGIVTARLARDRDGNIEGFSYGSADGCVKSYLMHEGGRRYFSFIHYRDGKIADETITWLRFNGSQYAVVNLEYGIYLNGPFEICYSGGHLKKSGFLLRGRPEGTVKTFHDNGGIKSVIFYRSGHRMGNYAKYNKYGGMVESGAYGNGRLEGAVKKYFDNGALKEEAVYRNGARFVKTGYFMSGGVSEEVLDEKLVLAGVKTSEMKDLRRLARVKVKLGKYGMEIYDPQSDMFPREREIRLAGSEYGLMYYSCEEELIKSVLRKEKFGEILEKLERAKSGKKTVWHFNEKGKMVRG